MSIFILNSKLELMCNGFRKGDGSVKQIVVVVIMISRLLVSSQKEQNE